MIDLGIKEFLWLILHVFCQLLPCLLAKFNLCPFFYMLHLCYTVSWISNDVNVSKIELHPDAYVVTFGMSTWIG